VIVVAAGVVTRLVATSDNGNQPAVGAQTDVTPASGTDPELMTRIVA